MELKTGWHVKGRYNEGCAAEGACPYYFGRAVENGCRYFMTFHFQDAVVNGVDLSGITVVYAGDIPHGSFEEFVSLGSDGGIYISDSATPEQRIFQRTDMLAVQFMLIQRGHLPKEAGYSS